MKKKVFEYTVDAQHAGMRVKDILSKTAGYSRREVTALNRSHGITLNGETCRLSEPVKENDVIQAEFTQLDALHHGILPEDPDILYEDQDLLVLNKPAGLSCHATLEHPEDHIGTLLKKHYGKDFVVRPAGRLDKDVSGVMCYAKGKEASAALAKEKEQGMFHKTYLAVITGHMEKKSGRLEYRLGKDAVNRRRCFDPDGQLCITDYEVLKEMKDTSLVRVSILTGRNHQIRAGFAGYGHPLIGDRLYGGAGRIARVALHCECLQFLQPFTKKKIEIRAPIPDDIQSLIH